ncbi:septum site-determining protein MinC [Cellulosilyticum sp. I15G10I2]|uniref:septum site-determining protein MinC n=1 Tax=Cellulosilyticum sp. I15G10I2 TaxID=1892843 RepID=UPI00085C7215|nr:septum site-determining protein MinC [Cellulosilyticum sp. I15G10I2]
MGEENVVVFKGTADGIIVLLDQDADFEKILYHFKEKLEYSKSFFKGSRVSVRFKGRSLTREQQDRLLMLLTNQNIINISFLHDFEQESKQEDNYLLWLKEQIDSQYASLTHFHYGIVRSGHHINYQGNIVVLGDVNPGGLVTAGGNVIILGALKGKVHAGMDKDFKKPFVVASLMAPIQIGIGNIIAQSPNNEPVYSLSNNIPQIAYLQEDQIYMDQIDVKTLNHMLK